MSEIGRAMRGPAKRAVSLFGGKVEDGPDEEDPNAPAPAVKPQEPLVAPSRSKTRSVLVNGQWLTETQASLLERLSAGETRSQAGRSLGINRNVLWSTIQCLKKKGLLAGAETVAELDPEEQMRTWLGDIDAQLEELGATMKALREKRSKLERALAAMVSPEVG